MDILRLLSLGDKQLSSFDISLRFTHLFWLGDLNYRLDMDIQVQLSTRMQTPFNVLRYEDNSNMCFYISSVWPHVGDFKLH